MTTMIKINKKRMSGLLTAPLLSILVGSATAQEKKLEALNIAYTSATPTRSPLWIAKEVGLFEKYGIDAKLIYIRAGSPSISALVSGDMHVSSDPAAAAAIAAARGAPIVVVGTYGLASYRLVAHPRSLRYAISKVEASAAFVPAAVPMRCYIDSYQSSAWSPGVT